MTASGSRLDELGQLEEQRRFLLRSLLDLDLDRGKAGVVLIIHEIFGRFCIGK